MTRLLTLLLTIISFLPLQVGAQTNFEVKDQKKVKKESKSLFSNIKLREWFELNNVADRLEIGVTLGTTGLGLELATPITKWTQVRAGVDWIPSIGVPMAFDINTFSDGLPSNNFSHVQEMVYNFTGIYIDSQVKMISRATMLNFKFLVDVYPFQQNKHWYFTAGFYAGGNTIAKSQNDISEKPTLVALNIYNRMYEFFSNITDVTDVPLGGGNYMDPEQVIKFQEKFQQYGRMGIHIGDFKKDGTPYIMEPASDGTVRAKAWVNRFKPYVGFGYAGHLDMRKKWKIGVEAGAMIWGGVPDVYDQNGVNLTKDLINIPGSVGNYIAAIKALPVFPVINLRISYTFF